MKMPNLPPRSRHILLLTAGIVLSLALYCLAAKLGFGLSCVFHSVTGLLCPGCGNSRAALALLQLDFASSWKYNPLFLPEIFYIGWVYFFCCRSYIRGKRFAYKPPFPAMDVVFLAAIVLWGIVRNFL